MEDFIPGEKSSYKQLKRFVKDQAFENAALSCEILETEKQFLRAKLERRYLLKRLLQLEKSENKTIKWHKKTLQKIEMTSNDEKKESDVLSGKSE